MTIPPDECKMKSLRGTNMLFKAILKICAANRLLHFSENWKAFEGLSHTKTLTGAFYLNNEEAKRDDDDDILFTLSNNI